MASGYKHGTPEVWDTIFSGRDLIYSEKLDSQNKVFEKAKTDFLKEIFPIPQKSSSMLEVGCGTGYVSLYFAKRGYKATCVDINKSILKVAQSNFKKEKIKGKFVVASAENLPFKDNTFDVVSSFGLMEHFEDPTLAFSEMVRVLKKGGILFADIVPNRFSVQTLGNIFNFKVTFLYWLLKAKPKIGWEKGIRNFRPLYFESNMSWYEYKKIMEKVGVKNLKVRGNRPYPRLTLPPFLDKIYATIIKSTLGIWEKFDRWDSLLPKFWGAGLWFWGTK